MWKMSKVQNENRTSLRAKQVASEGSVEKLHQGEGGCGAGRGHERRSGDKPVTFAGR